MKVEKHTRCRSEKPFANFHSEFESFEERHGVLDYETDGVYVWQSCRIDIFYTVARHLKILDVPHGGLKKRTLAAKISTLLTRFKFFTKSASFLQQNNGASDKVCVIEHHRSVNVDGKDIDIYSEKLVGELNDKHNDYIRLDIGASDFKIKTECANRYYLDLLYTYVEVLSLFISIFPNKNKKELDSIEALVRNEFNDGADVGLFLNRRFIKFKLLTKAYRQLFLKCNIKKLYVVVAYQCAPAICAAHNLGIEIIELQHGVVSRLHPGYGFPDGQKELAYLPDKFFAWSAFWVGQFVKLGTPYKPINYGFPFLYGQLEKHRDTPKNPHKIVVISQGSIGRKLASVILENIGELKEYEIHYKLHPGEYRIWRDYPELVKLSQLTNVTIIKACDLYELLASVRYMIGVYSTTIYEGIELGAYPVLVNLPGVEYMSELIDTGKGIMFSDFINAKFSK